MADDRASTERAGRDEADAERDRLAMQRQLALDAARMGWWHYDPVSRVATFDARYTEIFGVAGRERPNDEILKLLHPDDLPRVWAAVEAALDPSDPKPYATEYRIIHPDGGVRWIEAHGLAVFEGEGAARRAASLVGTVADVTDRKRAEDDLRERTALLLAISDTSGDVIFAKDRQGRIRFGNPATFALIGKPRDEVLGRTDLELLEDADAARGVMENDRRVMESGAAEELEERVPLPDGTDRVWLSRKSPYRDGAGNVVGLLGISRDITGRKRAEEALQSANERLREAHRVKDEFLTAASHELRTPLATLRLHTDSLSLMLDRGRLDEDRLRRKVTGMEAQLGRMQRLVERLLDVSRISAGRLKLERERLDLAQVAAEVVDRFADAAERSRVALRLRASPVTGDFDRVRMDQVLTNLLDNAIKFASGREVEVAVGPREHEAVLSVRDAGPGISEEARARIFEQYERAARAHAFDGLGLGLWIARQIVEAHGGAISVESEPGAGSTFTVTVPAREP